ncbi:unnamed protein product [Cyprideis torosa]|uniref:Uncharacterized protein n=1 Tax=Cyprideis torosa TaxID=163714 RepID=A0A7R8ZJ47_9CRUS|nr:unnamed protein product [Cyprideis torosa]CAG0887794.1 unnamed protein product [Cyprideis torosa]
MRGSCTDYRVVLTGGRRKAGRNGILVCPIPGHIGQAVYYSSQQVGSLAKCEQSFPGYVARDRSCSRRSLEAAGPVVPVAHRATGQRKMHRCLFLLCLLPPLICALPQDHTEQRQGGGAALLQNVLQFPQNVLNSIAGTRADSRIGEQCQYTTDCLETTKNSVCFNGTCLCNLGYRYRAASDECRAVDPCPVCDLADTCPTGEIDIGCDGTCSSAAVKRFNVDDVPRMIKSHKDWPANYEANTDVYYCLKAPAGRRVNFKALWMDLETQCGYGCDSVTIYNGCVAKPENILAFYTGDNSGNNECVTSYCNEMLIHFKTDGDDGGKGDQRSGFMGYYTESLYEEDRCKYQGIKKPAE